MSRVRESTCTICTRGFSDVSLRSCSTCNYVYHRKCINKWLLTTPKCPHCRTKMKPQPTRSAPPAKIVYRDVPAPAPPAKIVYRDVPVPAPAPPTKIVYRDVPVPAPAPPTKIVYRDVPVPAPAPPAKIVYRDVPVQAWSGPRPQESIEKWSRNPIGFRYKYDVESCLRRILEPEQEWLKYPSEFRRKYVDGPGPDIYSRPGKSIFNS